MRLGLVGTKPIATGPAFFARAAPLILAGPTLRSIVQFGVKLQSYPFRSVFGRRRSSGRR